MNKSALSQSRELAKCYDPLNDWKVLSSPAQSSFVATVIPPPRPFFRNLMAPASTNTRPNSTSKT
jgi:hypothetical protein